MASGEYVEYSSYLNWVWFAFTIVGALTVPPLVQYVVLRSSGARLKRKAWAANNRIPYLFRWWNPEDRNLTRWQFVGSTGVPALLMWAILVPYALVNPISAGAIGFALVNVMGNFWYSVSVLAKPKGTLVEEFEGGLRFHKPDVQ